MRVKWILRGFCVLTLAVASMVLLASKLPPLQHHLQRSAPVPVTVVSAQAELESLSVEVQEYKAQAPLSRQASTEPRLVASKSPPLQHHAPATLGTGTCDSSISTGRAREPER
jgi:hypothetical protein